jgi:hypothetical protein
MGYRDKPFKACMKSRIGPRTQFSCTLISASIFSYLFNSIIPTHSPEELSSCPKNIICSASWGVKYLFSEVTITFIAIHKLYFNSIVN